MDQEMLQQVALGIVSLLGTVVTGLLAWASKSIKQWLEGKAHAATFQCATDKLEVVTRNAVWEVEQTLVRQLKSEDNWNVETAKLARDTAVQTAVRHLGKHGLAELKGCLGQTQEVIEGMIRTYIEKHVRGMGSSGDSSPIVGMNGVELPTAADRAPAEDVGEDSE